jgi:hypothetical protein
MIFLVNNSAQKTATLENISSFQPKWKSLALYVQTKPKEKTQTKNIQQTKNKNQ